MEILNLPIILLPHYASNRPPFYASQGSVGIDLIASIDKTLELKSFERILVPNGIKLELPSGYEAQIRPRSGLAYQYGITVLNTPGTIDSDYRGEIKTLLINLSKDVFYIKSGMRISQMVIKNVVKANLKIVNVLNNTIRGEKGFGSTGY